MPKEEWGTKRICPTTGKRFYDMNRDPIVSPYTGQVVTIDPAKNRTMVADAEDAQTKKLASRDNDDEELLIEDDDDEDVDLGDDVLEEDDDDDDSVSFEELGDVAGKDDED
ncbi:TIGR02300 family protein [Pseudoroseicyclus sp. CXY001]|uniref:TIGR02300 family protein n=1 Tax=Pseudoroseicyclus sp. CXY001 TaxID=3242492 RepID=UPI00358DC970